MERIERREATILFLFPILAVLAVGCVGDPDPGDSSEECGAQCEGLGGAPEEPCTGGDCAQSCVDDCPFEGKRVCEQSATRSCGQHDGDPCLEWSEPVACADDQTCSLGVCEDADECEDECADGDRTCRGDGRATCGQFDEDACLEWSAAEPCGEGEICEDGRCEARECLDEGEDCVCGEDQCCTGHCCPILFICVSSDPEGDFCPFGEGPNG